MQDYRKLQVWQRAHALAVDVHVLTKSFPPRDVGHLVSQLRRASLSISANIAEGASKGSDREFHRFLQIALGSAAEVDLHIQFAIDIGLVDDRRGGELLAAVMSIRRMLIGLRKRVAAKVESLAERAERS